MKINKIFSFSIAILMSFMTFAVLPANAESVKDKKVIAVSSDIVLSDEDLAGLELDPAAFDGYIVDFNVTNLDITGTKEKQGITNYYVGRSVIGAVIQFDLTCSDPDAVMNETLMVARYSSDYTEEEPAIEGNTVTAYFGGTKALFPNTSNLSISASDKTLIYQAIIIVPEGSTATLTFLDGCAVNTALFIKGSATAEAEGLIDYDSAGCVTTPTFTLGKAEPETKTVGCLASMIYNSKFTGIEFTVTTDDVNATINPATKKVPFANLTSVESGSTTVTVGLNINGVPKTANVTATAKAY